MGCRLAEAREASEAPICLRPVGFGETVFAGFACICGAGLPDL